MRKREYIAISVLVTLASSVILVPGGFNSLKNDITNASAYDVVKLLAGNFTIDQINLTIPLSILGVQIWEDARDRILLLE